MSKNRDRLCIIGDILKCAEKAATKTRIMYSANLSYKLLEKYLTLVLRLGLVKENGCLFELTEEGKEFLINYNNLCDRYTTAKKLFDAVGYERKMLSSMCENVPIQK